MMKAIVTRYLGPTNFRGSRIKATAEGNISVTIPYPYELDIEDAHKKAALALVERAGWSNQSWYHGIVGGSIPTGYAWVFRE